MTFRSSSQRESLVVVRVFRMLCVFLAASGCSRPGLDGPAMFDLEVQQNYFANYDQTDAIEFLTDGGIYVDRDEPGEQKLDRPHILPLLQKLKTELSMAPIAVVSRDDEKLALAIVAKLPEAVTRADVEALLLKAQDTFPGEILQQWGYEWLSIDFLSDQDIKELDGLN